MNSIWPPQDQNLWYLKRTAVTPCDKDMHIEVAVIGGGMAGLSAAQEFVKQGKKIALFEQYFCGAGASGKSSGFITPNAELSLSDFEARFNKNAAAQIWKLINDGVEGIRSNIEQYQFDCGYVKHDSLFVATRKKDLKLIQGEYEDVNSIGYKVSLYDESSVRTLLGTDKFFGGVLYEDTFGINAYDYCQELKKHLESQGVLIFEETPVTSVNDHTLTTAHATITADFIVVCVDRFLPDLNILPDDVYQAQNFLMVSQQLTEDEVKSIFPEKPYMVWDTQFIYNYFRLTSDNRLLIGGGDLFTTYVQKETHGYNRIIRKLAHYIRDLFPQLNLQFQYQWSGLIGLSKDIGPIAGPDKKFSNIYYVTACAGLPIAAALGRYSAQYLTEGRRDMDAYFDPYRSFPIGGMLQKVLGKKLSFALCNVLKQNVP